MVNFLKESWMVKPRGIVRFYTKYSQLFQKLKHYCFHTEPKKTALALTLGICIGIIPALGTTFITLTLLGLVFRLNQFILQSVHLLVSPLQILLIPVFLKTGHWLFAPFGSEIQNTSEMMSTGFFEVAGRFVQLFGYGLLTWFFFSIITGSLMYRFWLIVLKRKQRKVIH